MNREEEIKKAAGVFYASSDDYTAYKKGFEEGAKWADKTMIEKACDLYRDELVQFNNLLSHLNPDYAGLVDVEKSYKDFKKALKGGEE